VWCLGCSALASVAWAGVGRANAPSGAPGDPPRGPPPEAFQACDGLEQGASCGVTLPDGKEMTGTCRLGPQGEPLACAPDGPPPGRHPPPESFQACSSLEEGESCAFTAPDGVELAGTCAVVPDGSGMACRPNHPSPQR
jgi:hypothetical protein